MNVDQNRMDRLKAIVEGKHVDSVVHEEVLRDDPVLKIINFNLFYGRKQRFIMSLCLSLKAK